MSIGKPHPSETDDFSEKLQILKTVFLCDTLKIPKSFQVASASVGFLQLSTKFENFSFKVTGTKVLQYNGGLHKETSIKEGERQ